MFTICWLIFWLVGATPALHQWNAWLVALIVCLVIDVLSALDDE